MTRVREHADVLVQVDANAAISVEQSSLNKQAYTATFSSDVYTVTPDINPTVWPTLERGLIIEFNLNSSGNSGPVTLNFNGVVDRIVWGDGSGTVMVADDLDSNYTRILRAKFNGTDWAIISDVSGSNGGSIFWQKQANGELNFREKEFDVAGGSATWTFPFAFIDTNFIVLGVATGGSRFISARAVTTTTAEVDRFVSTTGSVSGGPANLMAFGRWYN